jgi:hypothetical protein
MSLVGTNPTCRGGLTMSVDRGGPEGAGPGLFTPISTALGRPDSRVLCALLEFATTIKDPTVSAALIDKAGRCGVGGNEKWYFSPTKSC